MSPLENAAGMTQIEDEELQKKDKIEAAKVPEHKIQAARPSNSTTVQTGNELADQLQVSLDEDTKDKKPADKDLTTTGAAVETGSKAKGGDYVTTSSSSVSYTTEVVYETSYVTSYSYSYSSSSSSSSST